MKTYSGGVKGEKGLVDVIAAVIILAVTVAMTPTLVEVTKHVSETVASTSTVNAYVSVSDGIVTAINPSPMPISLNRVQLFVDGKPVKIEDENRNGIWEPYEKITFTLTASEDVISVSLYIDGKSVYEAVYVKPSVLKSDVEFPHIQVDVIPPSSPRDAGTLRLAVNITDDVAVVSRTVLLGCNGTENVYIVNNTVEEHARKCGKRIGEVTREFRDEIERFERTKHKGALLEELSHFNSTVAIPASELENVSYIRILAKDAAGKTSAKVVGIGSINLPVSVEILTPHDGEVFSPDSDVDVRAVAKNALGVSLFLDGELVLTKDCGCMRTSEVFTTVRPEVGEHTIKAVAWNALHVAEDSVRIDVRKDGPPSVEILSPNGTIFVLNVPATVIVAIRASDDIGVSRVVVYIDGQPHTAYEGDPFRTLSASVTVSLSEGWHEIEAVAYDTRNQTGKDAASFAIRLVTPPSIRIVSPHDGDTFVPGDPEIVAISRDERDHATTISLDGRQLKVISATLAESSSFSTGWVLMSGDSDLHIPNPGLQGSGTLTISVKKASEYGAAYTFRPMEKSGIADSCGVTLTVDVPSDARVRVTFASVLGVASSITSKSDHPVYPIYRKVLVFSAPEGAKAVKATATGWARTEESVSWFWFYAYVTDKPSGIYWGRGGYIHPAQGAILADKKGLTLAAKQYYQWKYHTTKSGSVTLEIAPDKATLLLKGKLLELIAQRPNCDGCREYCGIGGARISYYTEVKQPAVYVDGELVATSSSLDRDKLVTSTSFTLGPGKHTITLKSEYGAFRYRITIIPDSQIKDPVSLKVTAPFGSGTVSPNSPLTHSGSLSELFGTFHFDASPDNARYLVKVDYRVEEVTS